MSGAAGRDPLRVLLVEDSDDDAVLLLRALDTAGFDVTHRRVQSAAEMSAALSEPAWDVVLSDFSLPQFDGPAAFELLRRSVRATPFFLVSGSSGGSRAPEEFAARVDGAFVKGKLGALPAAIRAALGR